MVDLSIVIVTYNSAGCIRECLESVAGTSEGLQVELLVVDNASHDDTVEIVEQIAPAAIVIRNASNAGFPAANNQAIALARGRYVVLLNPDTIVTSGAFQAMVAFMDGTPSCGICGPILEDAHGRIAEDLRRPSFWLYLGYLTGAKRLLKKRLRPDDLEVLSGACILFRRRLVDDIGGLDTDLFWCEDIDFCIRAREKHYGVAAVSGARVIHLGGDSARSNVPLVLEKQYTSKIMYLRKHASPPETRLVILLFVAQLVLRAAKWVFQAAITREPQAKSRAVTCVRLIGEIPKYLWTAYPPRSGQHG